MSVSDTPWKYAFHSGMSSSADLRAATDLGLPVGVVATLLTTRQMFLTLPKHLNAGGKLLFHKLDPWVESLNKKGLTKKD